MALTALLNLINGNVTQQGSGDRITGTEVRAVLTAIVNTIQGDVSFSASIPFDKMVSKMATHQLVANVTLSPNTSGAVGGFGTVVRIIGGGSFSVNLSGFKKSSTSGSFVATSGAVNVFAFVYDGTDYWYSVFQEASASGQLSAPVLSITSGTSESVVLQWNLVSGATQYGLQRAENSAFTLNPITLAHPMTASTNTYTDTAPAGKTYYYRIYAGASGVPDSAYSNVVNVTPVASGNTTPAAPTVTADDSGDTLSASHALGTSEILVSENNGAYVAYSGQINVGNVARAQGYWKFKIKAATGRNESAVAESPAFTVANTATVYQFSAPAQIITVANSETDYAFTPASPFSVSYLVKLLATGGVLRMSFATATNRIWDVNVGEQAGSMIYSMGLMDSSGNEFYRQAWKNFTTNWVHVVHTYDGSGNAGGINTYVDGVLSNQAPVNPGSFGSQATGGVFRIGQLSNANQDSANTQLNNLTIIPIALTQQQVTDLVTAGGDPTGQSWWNSSAITDGWKFDNNLNSIKGTHNGSATTPQYV